MKGSPASRQKSLQASVELVPCFYCSSLDGKRRTQFLLLKSCMCLVPFQTLIRAPSPPELDICDAANVETPVVRRTSVPQLVHHCWRMWKSNLDLVSSERISGLQISDAKQRSLRAAGLQRLQRGTQVRDIRSIDPQRLVAEPHFAGLSCVRWVKMQGIARATQRGRNQR